MPRSLPWRAACRLPPSSHGSSHRSLAVRAQPL